MSKILVIKVHPSDFSFSNALADEYIKGAKESKHDVQIIKISELGLEKYLNYHHQSKLELSDHLLEVQNKIVWADHLVFVYPLWWGSAPASLKLFFEIIFTSGFAFRYIAPLWKIPRWKKLLKGRSARILTTMDSPVWYYKYIMFNPFYKIMKYSILGFSGIKPIRQNYFSSIKLSTDLQRTKWLQEAFILGKYEFK